MYELLEETEVSVKTNNNNLDAIVLLVDSGNFSKKSYDINLVGASMYNWVARACPVKPTLASLNNEDEILDTIRPLLKNSEYTLVLFSDTPLITASGVNELVDFAIKKDLPVVNFTRAYVFKTSYIKSALGLYSVNKFDNLAGEMTRVKDVDSLITASRILQNRIINFHLKNGVNIVSPQHTFIDSMSCIEAGATIEPFTKISNSKISKNAKVYAGSVVSDSVIGENAIIKSGAKIIGSVVKDNAIVGLNSSVVNKSVIGEETIISANVIVDNSSTIFGGKIGTNSILINAKLAKDANIGVCCKCLGSVTSDVKIGAGASVGDNCSLFAGVYLKADYTLEPNKTLRV